MQASLAMIGFFLGLATWWWQGRDAIWLVGAFVMLAPWPWTLLVIKPVNDRLKATTPEHAGVESRALIERWGRCMLGHRALGARATALFFWAMVTAR